MPDGGQRKTRDKQINALKTKRFTILQGVTQSEVQKHAQLQDAHTLEELPLKMLHKTQLKDNPIGKSFESKAQALAQQTAAEQEVKLEEAAFSFQMKLVS